VLIVRAPGGKLTWLRAMGSRRAAAITAILSFFTGFLITDGYTACQQMPGNLAGIQQCAAHVIRRCRAVSKLGPGSLQSWAEDVIIILRQAHLACQDARSRGQPPDPQVIADLRTRYDEAVSFGITHNRHRDWDKGALEWTNNVSEQGANAAKRHQAVPGYWHTGATLARWCRIRSYLDSATAHGLTALDAVSTALAGKPWLPPLPADDLLAAA
jgi:transposase